MNAAAYFAAQNCARSCLPLDLALRMRMKRHHVKKLGLAVLVVFATGCGTIVTTTNDDKAILDRLAGRKTHCAYISRVYSGVKYDVCNLYAQHNLIPDSFVAFYAFDLVFSGIADTLILPYTVKRQQTVGSIKVDGPS